jgi:phospholipid/cholesterol/gamma-HCH transport system ATP-binding protein
MKTENIKISISNLTKSFGNKEVLKGINLDIKTGESIVILGSSGCGKTVFIKILANLLKQTSGTVKIFSNRNKPQISFLFQLNALFDSYPNWKNICLANIENHGMKKNEAVKLAKSLLHKVGLGNEVAHLYPSDISGGMQKRVALARCIVNNPEIIFFDEPTSGLDPLTSLKISKLIREVGKDQNITKISIMHDIDCAKIVADKIVFLHEGKIEWSGIPDEMETSQNQLLNIFLKKIHSEFI